jgi:DNA-binding transcriptional regulator YiaG
LTPAELRTARHAFGLSAEGFARLVQVESGRTVRRWESGERDIPGPVQVLVGALMASRAVRRHFGVTIEADSTQNSG